MSFSTLSIDLCGVCFSLTSTGLVWLRDNQTLLFADSHFGKAATFRASGIPVPRGTTLDMLRDLTDAIENFNARRIIVLGDFYHSHLSTQSDFEEDLEKWRICHHSLEIILVKGNHDVRSTSHYQALRISA